MRPLELWSLGSRASPLNSVTLDLNISSKYHSSVCSEKNAKKFKQILIKKNTAEAVGTECIWQFGDANYGLETLVGTRENSLGKCDERSH